MPQKRGDKWLAGAYDPRTKGRKHLGTFDTRKEARAAEDEYRRTRNKRKQTTETCDTFAARWPQDYPRPKDRTNRTNTERVKPFLRDFRGVPLADVDRPTARKWALEHTYAYPAVRAMYSDAMNDGLVDHNPFQGLRIPQGRGRKDIVALTEQELRDLALVPERLFGEYGREFGAMILFAGYTGVRPGELFALERSDIQGENCRVTKAVSDGVLDTPKNHMSRVIAVPPFALAALDTFPAHDNGLLFAGPSGKRFYQQSHAYHWRKVKLLWGRPEMDFYDLRHCAATMMVERGIPAHMIAHQLGQEDGGALVMKLYGHPDKALSRRAILSAFGSGEPAGVVPLSERRREAG